MLSGRILPQSFAAGRKSGRRDHTAQHPRATACRARLAEKRESSADRAVEKTFD
jgi:hypothetical protein